MQRLKLGDLELSVIDPHERDTRYIYDEIFVAHVYHHPEMRLPERPAIMDVGANIGLYSIWAHRRYRPRAIYCYEPSPRTFAYLEDNTGRLIGREATRVQVFNRALAGAAGRKLVLNQSPLVSGISTLLDGSKVGWVEALAASGELITHDVVTSTVSAEMAANEIAHLDLLKIDVEGFFMEVLAGIGEADFARIGNIVAEIDYAEEAGVTPGLVEEALRARGYRTEARDLTLYAWRS